MMLEEKTMTASLSELIAALPAESDEPEFEETTALPPAVEAAALRPLPIGSFRRFTLLGTLQAKIAAAYAFHWLRGWFKSADERQRLLAETHFRTARRVLDSMVYLRGAVMKAGQTLAHLPDIAPREFVETLERLHFDAPPMHWSLLREWVCDELGDDPESLFAEFDKRAFAAASIGQVHRARLKSGEEVAVKIQYPGIARTIREDFRNLIPFLLPARLSKDWESTKDQFDDLRRRIEQETDYELEANTLEKARSLFREDDGIIVPRVYRQFSTARVLTMERLQGRHLEEYLQGNPSQEQRDEFARKLLRSWYRLMFAGRMLYADIHPGNFLFGDDGRLGVIDFGFMVHIDDAEWALYGLIDRALTTGNRADRIAAISAWSSIDPSDSDRIEMLDKWADWCWRARYCGGPFDFGDEADFQEGVNLFLELIRKRYSRARPSTPSISRQLFGWRSMLYRLRAKFEVRPIAEEEVKAAGWDRSEYA
jgi:aarF domain-containing kinase